MEIERIVRLMEEHDIAKQGDLVGVSEHEIAQLEHRLGIAFPAAYRQFLMSFGRSAGYLSTWMAIYFDDLMEIREEFDQLIRDQEMPIVLPKNALLISNLDSIFDYIFCNGSADPEVYRIDLRGDNGAYCEKYADAFSTYIEQLILNADTAKFLGAGELADFDTSLDDDLL